MEDYDKKSMSTNITWSHYMAHCIISHCSGTNMDNHRAWTNPFCLGRNQFKSLSCHQSKLFFKHYIHFFLKCSFFFSFIFQAIVINGKLENDISGCLKYPESIVKTMPPPSYDDKAVRTELFHWTQNDICDATQPK